MMKVYYLCRFTQLSPLSISSGENEETDRDLMRDSRGLPYLPGSSLAGVLRELLPESEANALFGYLQIGGNDIRESRIIVSDAKLRRKKGVTETSRDGVALTQEGVAKDTAKYDYQVVECTEPYEAVLELDEDDPLAQKMLAAVLRDGGLSIGGKTTRGFGRMKAEFRRKAFDLTKQSELESWLDYDPFAENAFATADTFKPAAEPAAAKTVHIQADIKLAGSLIIRVSRESDINAETLKNRKDQAVIPGTAWAGVFRHHMLNLAKEIGIEEGLVESAFGSAGDKDKGEKAVRSPLVFEETTLADTKTESFFSYKRNALDRFTMAPREGALYTEELCYGGSGRLEIFLPIGMDETLQQLLCFTLLDLHNGLVNVGGEGGVGRGLIKIEKITVNGADYTEELAHGRSFLPLQKEAGLNG